MNPDLREKVAHRKSCCCAKCDCGDRRRCIDKKCECCGEVYRHDAFMEPCDL